MRWRRRDRVRRGGHFVDDGVVACQMHRCDVDVELCYACPAFEDLDVQGDCTVLYCNPPTPLVTSR